MSFISNLQNRLHRYFLKQKIKKNNAERYSRSFNKVKHIGILFDATAPENEPIVSAYRTKLQEEGKIVDMLAYIDDNQPHDQQFYKYFNRKSLNWSLEPKGEHVEQFTQTPFDILLNLHLNVSQPLEYISTLSKAHLRVGQFRDTNNEECYDLSIDTHQGDNLKNFIGQVDYYIKSLNK